MMWIIECEKEDMPVVTHCYDEIVTLVNDDEAEECLGIMDQIMCEPPSWAPDVPLASEGFISKFYTK
jgi:DNA polymerase